MYTPISRTLTNLLLLFFFLLLPSLATSTPIAPRASQTTTKHTPKIFIISLFTPEATTWYTHAPSNSSISSTNLLSNNITLPLLSPLFPSIHCTPTHEICQLVTGEAEINAATSLTALLLSPLFNLSKTYFLVAGIAGVNPEHATLGSAMFARYAVQVGLQYELDPRELGDAAEGVTGYIAQGARAVGEYPRDIYGTEVFELNDELRHVVAGFARGVELSDSALAHTYRSHYITDDNRYFAGTQPPSVVECDVATSDTFFSGKLLAEGFADFTALMTNGTGVYCSTAQEDNALLEGLVRGHVAGLVDFERVVVLRTGSDMDRPYPGQPALENLFGMEMQGGYPIAIANVGIVGWAVVEGILGEWDSRFEEGVKASNYVGDILGTLGGTPDFGPGI
ncbi:unnamed protein product [Periconia digitata]|uniref:Purine nucleoside permease n=1 Tax=Periconia digitata TaxID=1303443 RepID=A0A9W4XWF5_9PLEO|nr:unnamed protein product [Periconia digitata]